MADPTISTTRGRRPLSWIGLPVINPDLPQLWGRRPSWETRSRWMIAPLIALAVGIGRMLGFEFAAGPILLIAAVHPIYNTALVWAYRRSETAAEAGPRLDRSLLLIEVLADYLAVFALIHFTGGVQSPLSLILIFHVILAAIQFSRARAHLFASWAAAGLWLMLWFQESGWLTSPVITFQGEPILFAGGFASSAIRVVSLTAIFFLSALLVGQIMENLRRRVSEVAQTTVQLSQANQKLASLYAIVRGMGAERRLQPILDLVAGQLASVVEDTAIGIALLEDDGCTLRFAASHGLPTDFVSRARIDRRESPFHDRVLRGETVVQGKIQSDDSYPLRSKLAQIGVHSIALAPMEMEGRVLGTLGLYSTVEDRFRGIDAAFLEMMAELVAIAIEDARANEAIESLVRERTQLMLQVAHNLRAPLGASLGLLDLVVSGYTGPLDPRAREHLDRVVERLRSLDEMVGELLRIARSRDWAREIPDILVQPAELAGKIEETFRPQAEKNGLRFLVNWEDDMPAVESGGDLLERIVENLVSNAIKYTPKGGEVELRLERREPEMLRITVRDSGIGIPESEQDRLFGEFFRASNAKRHTTAGTGLGLAFVKYAVERHRGHLSLTSREGEGTTVVIDLHAHRPESGRVPEAGPADPASGSGSDP